MAYTIRQLEALEEALATGVLTATYDGKSVTYRSVGELIRAIDRVRAGLSAMGLLPERVRRTYAYLVRA
ncbi:MAG: phage head-tail joining protein [Burkholderiales bacterium]